MGEERERTKQERYEASMFLAGVGDCLGYKNSYWEFNKSGFGIHQELEKLGGLEKLEPNYPEWIVSDDTVMLIATAEAMADYGKTHPDMIPSDEMYIKIGEYYLKCLGDMDGRSPGMACILGISELKLEEQSHIIPFNERGGGCGAAMRSMCLGLIYSRQSDLDNLIAVSIESGRMSHHHPVGYLGSFASAYFVHCALVGYPIESWAARLIDLEKKIQEYIRKAGIEVEKNLKPGHWNYFWDMWKEYVTLRKIQGQGAVPEFNQGYENVNERDILFKEWSYSGWAGSSGHDAPMIAYDAILYAKNNWKKLADIAFFHGGDSDSTAVIAGAIFGALYGYESVPKNNYRGLEYGDRLKNLGNELFGLSRRMKERS